MKNKTNFIDPYRAAEHAEESLSIIEHLLFVVVEDDDST